MVSSNVTQHQSRFDDVERARRIDRNRPRSVADGSFWLGKSTIAVHLEDRLTGGLSAFVLDGDNVRHGLCGDLGFPRLEREENIRRIGEVAHLFQQAGVITSEAFISLSTCGQDRMRARPKAGSLRCTSRRRLRFVEAGSQRALCPRPCRSDRGFYGDKCAL